MIQKTKSRWTAFSLSLVLGLVLSTTAAPRANAVEFSVPAINLCFGVGFGFSSVGGLFDYDDTGGFEILVSSANDWVKLDDDDDQLAEGTLIRKLRLLDSNGADMWGTPVSIVLGVGDALASFVADATPFASKDVPTRLLEFFPLSFVCEGAGVVEVGGQKYMVATLGVSGAEGDAMSGTDHSIIKVVLINFSTGAVVQSHKIVGQGSNNLLLFESGVGDFDGDGDDELFIVRSVYLGAAGNRERFKIIVEVFNLLTKAQEKRIVFFTNDEFLNDNPVF